MRRIEIIGDNYSGRREHTRSGCRALVLRDGLLLLSYETRTDIWMLPGGGLEEGEEDDACCVREVAEETGFVVQVSPCALEIDEFYEDCKYVGRYFFGTVVGECERRLTPREAEAGMEPRWLPLREAAAVFSRHAEFADTDEMKRGLYLREHTALCALVGELGEA